MSDERKLAEFYERILSEWQGYERRIDTLNAEFFAQSEAKRGQILASLSTAAERLIAEAERIGGEPLRHLDIARGILKPGEHRYAIGCKGLHGHLYELEATDPEAALALFVASEAAEGVVRDPRDLRVFEIGTQHIDKPTARESLTRRRT